MLKAPRLARVQGHSFFPGLFSANGGVFDLGANMGEFSKCIQKEFGSRCLAVEANVSLVSEMAKTHPGLQVIHAAAWHTASEVDFTLAHHPEFSSLLSVPPELRAGTVKVRSLTLAQILAQSIGPIDLVKMDIEGAEVPVLLATPIAVLKEMGQLTVEFHDAQGLSSQADLQAVFARLSSAGFDRYRFSLRHHGDTLFVNRAIHPRPHRVALRCAVARARASLAAGRCWQALVNRLRRLR